MEHEKDYDTLPEVEIYAIASQDAERLAVLLTKEAVTLIGSKEAEGIAIVEENEVRGAICVRISPFEEQVMELLSLYVAPDWRRRALGGTLLLEALERGMEATDGLLNRIECTFSSSAEGVEAFLQHAGFRIQTVPDSAVWCCSLEQAAKGKLLQGKMASAKEPVSLSKLSLAEQSLLMETLDRRDVAYFTREELSKVHREISFVLFDAKDPSVIQACAIWSQDSQEELSLLQFFFLPSEHKAPVVVLRACLQAMQQRFSGTTVLTIPTLTSSAARLVQQITGLEESEEHLCYAVLSTHI